MVVKLNIKGHLIGILYHFDVQTWAKGLCKELFGSQTCLAAYYFEHPVDKLL